MPSWILFALLSAFGAAAYSLALKRALGHAGVLLSSVAYRVLTGTLLLAVALLFYEPFELSPGYWRTLAIVTPLEALGLVCLTLALRKGELSLVQPLLGMIALVVMAGGVAVLGEIPTAPAMMGILMVSAGIYALGLSERTSPLAPLRALARDRAAWFALGAALFWGGATVFHKFGIAEVGPFAWGASLMFASCLALALVIPFVKLRTGSAGAPTDWTQWTKWSIIAGLLFTIEQAGLHLGLERAQAGYVSGVQGTSALWGVLLGVILLGERSARGPRLFGSVLISVGVALVGFLG